MQTLGLTREQEVILLSLWSPIRRASVVVWPRPEGPTVRVGDFRLHRPGAAVISVEGQVLGDRVPAPI